MALYVTDKLITEARRLAAEFRKTTGKPLGISTEIAEFDAARLLNLDLIPEKPGGYDAVGKSGSRKDKRVQIKGRAIFDETKGGQRIGQLKTNQDWDSVVLVIMNEEYEPVEIYEGEREDIENALDEQQTSNRAKRGAMSVAKFKHVARLVWNAEKGLLEE